MATSRGFRGRSLALATLLGLGALAATPAQAAQPIPPYTQRYGYLCTPGHTWPEGTCCNGLDWESACATKRGRATARRNILLVISDDQDYCLYGFMAGLCSGDPTVSCLGEGDCGASGRCVSSQEFGACTGDHSIACYDNNDCTGLGSCDKALQNGLPLRLNDLTCRNRQPKRPTKDDQYCVTEGKLDRENLGFYRGEAPCNGTPADARPVIHTPRLDELAAEAVVFPRAYVAGLACKNSRRTMMHGRYQRHLQWLWENGGKGKTECRRLASSHIAKGCPRPAEGQALTACGDRVCEAAHTPAWWLSSARATGDMSPADVHLPPGTDADGQCGGGTCQNLPGSIPCADNHDCDEGGYARFGFAKTEVMAPGQGGFDERSKTARGIGTMRCEFDPAATSCADALTAPDLTTPTYPYPTSVMFDLKQRSLYPIVEAIDATIEDGGGTPPNTTPPYRQHQPFFIWYGPHLPHTGPEAEQFFYDLYPGRRHKLEQNHYASAAWLDAGVGGLVYHLRRACTCQRSGSVGSLWDNTVLLFLTDQGFLLPQAKGTIHENTQRTPLLVSTPEQRLTGKAAVYWDEIPSAIDLIPTILAYAGDVRYFPNEQTKADYLHGRDLKAFIDAPTALSWANRRRHLIFGEIGRSSVHGNTEESGGYPRYVLTRPRLLGVCQKSYNFTDAHPYDSCGPLDRCRVHPCLGDDDCTATALGLGECVDKDDTTDPDPPTTPVRWRRCVNRPDVRCADDAQCAAVVTNSEGQRYPDLCDASTYTCRDEPGKGSFKDFVDRSCSTGTTDCVPPGVCRPLLLKAVANDHADIDEVYDLEWDPDQRDNLLAGSYMKLVAGTGETLAERFMNCLKNYAKLDAANKTWDDLEALCPAPLANWR